MSDIFNQNRLFNQQDFFQRQNARDYDFLSEEAELRDLARRNNEELLANKQKYMVDLSQEEYAIINEAIANSEIPEDESYRWATALEFNKQYGVSIQDAYANLEDYTKAIWGEERSFTPKSSFKAIVDSGKIGVNTLKQGNLGNQIMIAEISGDEEKAARLLEEYEAIEQENLSLSDNQDRRWYIDALKYGAQSAPFTGYVATAGLIGGLVSGGIGTAAAFAASMQQAAGMEYMQLRKAGASKENALAMSVFSGSLQALVETALGNVAGVLGKNAVGAGAKKAIFEKLTGNLFKHLHYDGTFAKLALKMGSEYVKENFEEGMEEVIQDLISKGTHYLSSELEGYDIDPMTAESVAKDAWENFKGGVLGSLVLGIGSTAYNTNATIKEYKDLKDLSEKIPSKEVFKDIGKKSRVVEGMSETEADEILDKLYDNGKSKRDESIQKTADDIAEVYSADERMEVFDAETDENGNIIEGTEEEVTEEVRDDDGNLFHEIAEPTENKDGTYSTEMVFGDPSKESENNYGYVKLTINDDNNSVTIDEFKTGMKRGNLRNEMFADVAKQFSGYDIVWNPKGKLAQSIKDEIVSLNPQGKEAGLNYFNQNAVTNADTKARQMALRQLTENTKLQPSERAGIVAIMGAIAKNQNKSFSDWYNGTFYNGQMFGDVKELYDNVAMQSEQDGTKIKPAGGMKIKDTIDGARAVIYAAENADFSTLAHELSHVWQKQLFGQDAADAARIFGASEVRDADGNVSYDWSQKTIKTKGIDKNGNPIYISPAENFAYSFEKWLKDGKAPSVEQENIFKKFAQFMKNVIETLRNYIDMKPEISDYFNKNFKVTDEMMQTAENEAADFNADGSTKPTNKVAENVASQETTETSENITISGENLTENDEALSDEEIETLVSDFTNEELKTLIDAGLVSEEVAQAVKETKLDDVTQAAVASILDDPSIPQEKKIEAVMKANGESFLIKQQNIERYQARTDLTAEEKEAAIDDILNNRTTDRNGGGQALSTLASGKDMLFQIIGTQGAQALDEANEETFRMDNQRIAEEMEKAGKDARAIRMATGWERGADGEWKYEILDFKIKENAVFKDRKSYLTEEEKTYMVPDGRDEKGAYVELEAEMKLSDLIEDVGGLLKAYPEFADMKVIKSSLGENVRGSFDGKRISLSDKLFTETEPGTYKYNDEKHTVIHEIQHAIQHKEGFASGGNLESFTPGMEPPAITKALASYSGYTKEELKDFTAEKVRNQFLSLGITEKELNEWSPDIEGLGTVEEIIERDIRDHGVDWTYEEIQSARELVDNAGKINVNGKKYYSAFDAYRSIAGEVESRNTQFRADMTMEERRRQLLEDTEDVARDEQIVTFGNPTESKMAITAPAVFQGKTFEDAKKIYPNIIDVSELFNEHPTVKDLKEYLKNTVGKETVTFDKSAKVVIPQKSDKRKHIVNSSRYNFLNKPKNADSKERHEAYVISADELISNSTFDRVEPNKKVAKKPDVLNYYHFNVPVFIDGHGWNVDVVAEETKKSGAARPQNNTAASTQATTQQNNNVTLSNIQVNLYDFVETNMLFQEEIEDVRKEYASTDKWLKAPNEENTNLSENQWLQVRTSNFKNWFGDWENDPANASKVVDENGEPLVIYHGSYADFDVFDRTKTRANMDIQGNFFSPWEIDAQGYGPNVRAFYLSIQNPADSRTAYAALNKFKGQNEAGIKAREYLISQGYDGVNNDNEEYIAFYPEQIKSATDNNGDYSSLNPSIYFQETIDQSILNEAATFSSWMEFMDYMSTFGDDSIPQDAGADWYLNTWEIAHNVSPTTAERNAAEMQAKQDERENARRDPVMVDAEWYTMIQKEGNLEAFLKNVYQATHIDAEEMASLNPDEAEYVQDIINRAQRMFHHGVYTGNIIRVHNGKTLTNKARETMLNLMSQRKRDYRAIYADITGQSEYAVEKSDLQKENANIAKDAIRYRLINYASEVDAMSPEEKTKLLNQIKDEQVREKFKKDNVKMLDPDVEHYIGMQESAIKNLKKEMAEMRTEFNDDIERFASKQERDIIRQYESYLSNKGEAEFKKIPLPQGSKNAERVGESYKRQVQSGMKHSFSGMVLDWDAYKTEVEANVKLQERLRAENKLAELEEKIRAEYDAKRVKTLMSKAERLNAMAKEYSQKQQEIAAAKKLREMRKALVKRVMRRVNFNSIDYNRAKQIIAVQKVFEPNLRGGINKWIGTENKLAREVWSAWSTDFETKEAMLKRLTGLGKYEVIRLLEDTRTEEDFEKLTQKDLKKIEKAMPRQDWIKELKLDVWKEERDNALQLPIKEVTSKEWRTQADGTKKEVEVTRAEFPSDIEELLVQSIGQDMTYAIQYRHFEDWTTADMEELARRIDKMFKDGRDNLAAKREAERIEADRIRAKIREAINNTGIVINDDDSEDVKKKKQAKIDKILGINQQLPGSAGSKNEKQQNLIDRLLHSYHDANVRRVARLLDNYSEGDMTNLLYWQENDCFNKEERAKSRRNAKIDEVIASEKLDMRKLGKVVEYNGTKFSWDDVLMIWAAKMNQDDYYAEQLKDNPDLKPEYALEESAYKAIKYGNMIRADERENFRKIDEEILKQKKEREEKLHAAELAGDEEGIRQYSQIPSDMVDENGNFVMQGTEALKALAEQRIKGLLGSTTDIYKEFKPLVDAIRKDYSEEFDRINEVSIKEFNAPVWREKWYLPLIRLTVAGDTHEQRLKQDLLGHSAGTGKAGTEKGFTKKRVEIGPMNQAPVELGLYSTWADSVDRNEHFIAYASYVRELNRVFTSKDSVGTMQDIENRYGKSMKDYIDVYIKEVANPNLEEPKKGLDRVMHIMRGNTAPAYLGWKFSSILKQGIESPAPFMQFINPAEYMHGAIQLATKKWTRDSIGEKSAFMKSRVFDPIADLINENVEKSFSKKSYYLKKFQQKGMEGLEWIDWACVAPGWIAIYEKEYAKLQATEQARYEARVEELTEQNDTRYGQYHLTEEQIKQQAHDDVAKNIEEEAVNKADDCVRLCQPSNRKVDLAPMFKNNSEAAKAVLQFQTALNVIWQNIRYDIPYAAKNKQYMNIVGMVCGYVMAGVMSGMVCEGLLGGDDDEPEDIAKRLGYYATTQFIDSVPIVGGNLDGLAKKAITGDGGGIYNSSIWPTFDKYFNAASAFVSEDYNKALRNMEQGLMLTAGLPLSGAKELEAALGIGDKEEGLDFYPEAILGRRK